MTFAEIYDRIIPFWGNVIEFHDGELIGDGLFRSANLGTLWDKIEAEVGNEDTFGALMVWTTYQEIHKYALQLFENKVYSLNPKDIDKKDLEESYFQNLKVEGWEHELSLYERKK